MLAAALAQVAEQLDRPFMLERVLVTNQFQDDVNLLLQKRSGLTGYVAARSNVHAVGKTIWTRSQHGGIGFAVVIDANSIGSWGLNNARCLTTVLHELTHVLYEPRHLERLGEAEYTAVGDTRERWLDRSASILLDEFDVDRTVDAVVRSTAPKDDGQPWSLRELEEAQGVDWTQWLLDGLNRMPHVIDEKVWRFRTSRMEIGDLAAEVIPYVNDLLTVVSHTAAIYLGTEQWPEILRRIKQTEASQRFFSEHLDSVLGQLNDPLVPFASSVETVASAVEGIFRKCGLNFETVDGGVYIRVDWPVR